MRSAIGTSVLIIAMKSFAGAAGHLAHVHIPSALTGGFTAIAIVASLFGARLTNRVPHAQLRRGFGVFVLAMGGIMVVQETGLFELMREQVWIAAPVGFLLLVFVWWVARTMRPAPSPAGDRSPGRRSSASRARISHLTVQKLLARTVRVSLVLWNRSNSARPAALFQASLCRICSTTFGSSILG